MSSRSPLILAMPCIACEKEKMAQPSRTEEHHLNTGGRAGQKRRGDDYSIPLCGWHHRGAISPGRTASWMAYFFGPSLARSSKRFRDRYGTDDELLEIVNSRLDMGTDMGIR